MNTPGVFEMPTYRRGQIPAKSVQQELTDALESGAVVCLPGLDFPLSKEESGLLDPRILAGKGAVGYTPVTGKLSGTRCFGAEKKRLKDLMSRYSRSARDLVSVLFPLYKEKLRLKRASLRPAEIAARKGSLREDDTRVQVDALPSEPTGGDRVLRVFCNVNPAGKAHEWRLGEPFEAVARHFLPRVGQPVPGSALLLYLLRRTKTMQSEYDFIMLKLRDAMAADEGYQLSVGQEPVLFQPGTTWVCFTDSVSHAALSGQHQLEQTVFVPVDAMWDVKKSPLRVLERLRNRDLD
jgi:hypothetical protein